MQFVHIALELFLCKPNPSPLSRLLLVAKVRESYIVLRIWEQSTYNDLQHPRKPDVVLYHWLCIPVSYDW